MERVTAEKGSALSERELVIVDERTRAAHAWLDAYAPPDARIEVQRDALPAAVADLAPDQRANCAALSEAGAPWPPPNGWGGRPVGHLRYGQGARDRGRGRLAALYAAFLGRTSGPRAG